MIGCKWASAGFDASGYASAARGYIDALTKYSSVDLTLEMISFEKEHTSHGAIQRAMEKLVGKPIQYQVKVCHCTPENFPQLIEKGKYNIGYVAWETSKLPGGWADLCNTMDEIWVPSTWNKEVFEGSGVTKPVMVLPHVIELPDPTTLEHVSVGAGPNTYIFYSIFQWIERKNPQALLKAYLTEFGTDEDVLLAVKSYRLNTSATEQQRIKDDISLIKRTLQMTEFPPVRFFGTLLTSDQIKSLHSQCHCFVLPQRAEGFGLPIAEAMAWGKPVITTNYGGVTDFITHRNSLPIDYFLTPVAGMLFGNYNGWMDWAEPSIEHMRKSMRYCFEHRDEAKKIGEIARQDIITKFNGQVIANQIQNRLQEI
jgi:glycosyltransferase involved in cell wall biosynthesis